MPRTIVKKLGENFVSVYLRNTKTKIAQRLRMHQIQVVLLLSILCKNHVSCYPKTVVSKNFLKIQLCKIF